MKKKAFLNLANTFSIITAGCLILSSCTNIANKKEEKPINSNPPTKLPIDGVSNPNLTNPSINPQTPPASSTNDDNKPQNELDVEYQQVQGFINSLSDNSFRVVQANTNNILNRETIKVADVSDKNFILLNASILPAGWKQNLEVSSRSEGNGTVSIKVSFSKKNKTVQSNEIMFSGFKSIATSIDGAIFDEITVGAKNNRQTKKAINLGNVNYKTIIDLNKQTPVWPDGSASTKNGFSDYFVSALSQQKIEKIKQTYPEFKKEDIYLTGSASVSLLWRDEGQYQVSFYLVPKKGHSLKIKSKSSDFEVDVPGLVAKNILPDDIDITVGTLDIDGYAFFDPKNQSNLDAYKKEAHQPNSAYVFDEVSNRIKLKVDNDKEFKINSITIPYIPPKNNTKILFKSRYIYDGIKVEEDFYRTRLRAKKIVRGNNLTSEAVSSDELLQSDNELKTYYSNTSNTLKDNEAFFWNEFALQIFGSDNREDGKGRSQLKDSSTAPRANREELIDSNREEATNYLLFSRIAYNSINEELFDKYLWLNTITILHIKGPAGK
ncbi:hypothetical protein [Mycoplasma sp. E35C]|uniref:hypothetical protein n=1 Tax=Mycoplasma sp. E35C TaxID=2801918 RepID=UPI001CA3FAFE|nr:hypothetical protein [Mycoplasma sp. E35C]QZX48869.1 hypothetical protein JJE79_02310 [Mycoplasma sp. E35C]